jgi:hypothetical protein
MPVHRKTSSAKRVFLVPVLCVGMYTGVFWCIDLWRVGGFAGGVRTGLRYVTLVPMRSTTAIKLSGVGVGHVRDEGNAILDRCLNVAGMARSYRVIVLNLMAVMRSTGTRVTRKSPGEGDEFIFW